MSNQASLHKLFFILRFIWTHPLASRNRFLAITKFIKFQIAQRINPYFVLYPLVGDSCMLLKRGMTGASGNIYTGLLEFNDMALVLHALRNGDIFADIGANVGVYTILAAKNAGATVYSVEPAASTFNHLRNNVVLNGVSHLVNLFPVAVGMEETTLLFTNTLDTENRIVMEDEYLDTSKTTEVPVKTIDSIVCGHEPVMIKIDIEGFEWAALNGSKKILSGSVLKAVIIELNGSSYRYGCSTDTIHEFLLSYRFKPFHYDPFLRRLTPLETYGPFNTIYIRDEQWMTERLIHAEKFTLLNMQV